MKHSTEAPLSPRSPGTKSAAATLLQMMCQWPRDLPRMTCWEFTTTVGCSHKSVAHGETQGLELRLCPFPAACPRAAYRRTPRQEVLACTVAEVIPSPLEVA